MTGLGYLVNLEYHDFSESPSTSDPAFSFLFPSSLFSLGDPGDGSETLSVESPVSFAILSFSSPTSLNTDFLPVLRLPHPYPSILSCHRSDSRSRSDVMVELKLGLFAASCPLGLEFVLPSLSGLKLELPACEAMVYSE
jgi:hypothetical protein